MSCQKWKKGEGGEAAQESGTIMLIKKMINAAGGFVMLE